MSFKIARYKAGKKAADTAEHLGVSLTTVSQWETGAYLPSADKLPKIAAFYGCTIEELLDGNPRKEKREDENATTETAAAGV